MKIRLGFVSNSSSSSFVLFLPHEPQTTEELAKMLDVDIDGTHDYYGDVVSNREALNLILERIKNESSRVSSVRYARYLLSNGMYIPRYHHLLSTPALYDEYGYLEAEEEHARKLALARELEIAAAKYPELHAYHLTFHDHDPLQAFAESGILFEHAVALKTSHH